MPSLISPSCFLQRAYCPGRPTRVSRIFRAALAALAALLWAALCRSPPARPWPPESAASTTILTGKVVTTVTRAVPIPFNAVVDEVLVKSGDAVEKGSPLLRYHLQEEAERILQREVTIGAATENLKGQVLDFERQLAETTAQRTRPASW